MPVTVVNGAFAALTARFTHDGQENINTFHYQCLTVGSTSWDLDQWVTDLALVWDAIDGPAPVYKACISVDVTDIQWWFQVIHPNRYPKRLLLGNHSGTVAGGALPPQVAHVLTLRGEFSGPRYKANKHLGGQANSFTSNGMLTTAGREAITNLGDVMIAPIDLDDPQDRFMEPHIFRRDTPSSSPTVSDYVIGATTRTMRRRTVGLGS